MLINKYSPKQTPSILLPVGASLAAKKGVHEYKDRFLEEYALKNNVSLLEAYRRDDLIRENHLKCDFKAGDTVYPMTRTDYERLGPCLVLNIAKDLKQYGTEQWPKSDNPFIIHLSTLREPKQVFSCTSGWACSKNSFLKLAC